MRWHIPKEYKDLALHMSLNENVSDVDIHRYVGISSRAMRHLQRTFAETGETVQFCVNTSYAMSLYLCLFLSFWLVS